ncbi:putative armadillo-like helical, importin beta family [Helianthus annuus]|uniref:Armadillo-like helical, importin beta family n=1 Tax=Helianthus annuus TaxID=4232 RepID=A0A9K3J3S3_HELAN|nr:putative armadillo-like helical, importin beta family [Helianthus annuus]KAJ0595248.1 putative armadillo-like helical, importin beta family [Helianthus annuus]KAJ0924815.1 putative armadillo-like helical, importin beta family [Helianthus annuus]
MDAAENSPPVRLAATRALKNALELDEACYRAHETVSVVFGATAETERADIRQAAFECLGSVVSTHYAVLEPYREILVERTINALEGDETALALPAIEFWSCICHEEMKLSRVGKSGHRFVETALTRLVSELLGTLLKQDRNDDNRKLAVAGGTCLGLVARTVRDAVIPLVRPFALENISNTDPRYRQAATRACGSYLEGVSVEYLDLPYLLTAMKEDQDRHVQATAQSCVIAVARKRIEDSPEKFSRKLALLRVFEHGSALVREKTMLAVGALACAIGPEFMTHMHLFSERLKTGLVDWNNHEVRFASYRVAGDLCRALDYKVLPFCEVFLRRIQVFYRDVTGQTPSS